MKKQVKRRVLIASVLALAVSALLASKAFCRCSKQLDTRGWGLKHFVTHLNDQGIRLRVVPSRADGRWSDTIYLTTDPSLNWDDLQLKNLNAERIRQWGGTVWVHRIGPQTDVEGRLMEWQGHGRRVAGFLVFGDAVLIDRIKQVIPSKETWP